MAEAVKTTTTTKKAKAKAKAKVTAKTKTAAKSKAKAKAKATSKTGGKAPATKRRYVERPDMRIKLLDAAEAVVREEGYAAATVRRIATRAGVTHQAVFYYFGSQDELLLSLLKRASEVHRHRLEEVLKSDNPIRGMWDVVRDQESTSLGLEFMALANHNESIREEIARNAEVIRELETEAIARHLEERGVDALLSPQMVSILTNALARLLVQEASLGIHAGHDEAEALVDMSFDNFEARSALADGVVSVVAAISPEK